MIDSKRVNWLVAMICAVAVGPGAIAQEVGGGVAMPDPRQMSGIPLPVGDVQTGTVTVRVIRGSLANVIPNHPVELRVDGRTSRSTTDSSGRAMFSNLAPGAQARAVTAVAGEKLESQDFQIPPSGGIRIMLVATDPDSAKRAAEDQALAQGPAQPGAVVLGDQTRFVIELADDSLSVFNILQILNTARVPVQPPQSIAFDLPDEAEGAAMLEGSSSQATLEGRRVTVSGPFAPGATVVQFAYSLPYSGDRVTIEQRLPIQMTSLAVLAQKTGQMHLTSPQIAGQRDMTAEGQTYIVAQGPGLPAGEALRLEFSGLPHAPTWPRNLALALAVVILAAGAWASARGVRGASAADGRRRKLQLRRNKLLDDLTSLEEQHRAGRLASEHFTSRRQDLVAAIERVYGEIDEEATA